MIILLAMLTSLYAQPVPFNDYAYKTTSEKEINYFDTHDELTIAETFKDQTIEYDVIIQDRGILVYDFLLVESIYDDNHDLQNLCSTTYWCVDCPDNNKEWLEVLKSTEFNCTFENVKIN